MILYKRGARHFFAKLVQWRGSVFPQSFSIALPCALCTAILQISFDKGLFGSEAEIMVLKNSAAWSGFTTLVGFLIVFRTSQAYARYWDGCTATHKMRAEWFDACSSLVAFCRFSADDSDPEAEQGANMTFQQILIRLFSMLHAAALADIEDSHTDQIDSVEAFRYSLLDARAIDRDSLKVVMESDAKVELLLQWIQQLIIDNVKKGVLSIPPPLLTRSFQELFNGVVEFQSAVNIATIPFPFPYSQMCDILLVMHWLGTPVVTAQWVTGPWWGALFSFMQVFIYWCLNMIAVEIENPFGQDPNDLDGEVIQNDMNRHLLLLLEHTTKRTPTLRTDRKAATSHGLMDVWKLDHIQATAPFSRPVAFRRADKRHSRDSLGSNLSMQILEPNQFTNPRSPLAGESTSCPLEYSHTFEEAQPQAPWPSTFESFQEDDGDAETGSDQMASSLEAVHVDEDLDDGQDDDERPLPPQEFTVPLMVREISMNSSWATPSGGEDEEGFEEAFCATQPPPEPTCATWPRSWLRAARKPQTPESSRGGFDSRTSFDSRRSGNWFPSARRGTPTPPKGGSRCREDSSEEAKRSELNSLGVLNPLPPRQPAAKQVVSSAVEKPLSRLPITRVVSSAVEKPLSRLPITRADPQTVVL